MKSGAGSGPLQPDGHYRGARYKTEMTEQLSGFETHVNYSRFGHEGWEVSDGENWFISVKISLCR
jgi:hypothetical protein